VPPEQIPAEQGAFVPDGSMLPAAPSNALTGELVENTDSSNKSSGFSLPNLGEIKGFVDRLGGIDGILNGVTKVQKVVSSVSQMAPLIKVLLGSFSTKKKKEEDEIDEWKPRPRKRRKSGSGSTQKRRRPTNRKRKR